MSAQIEIANPTPGGNKRTSLKQANKYLREGKAYITQHGKLFFLTREVIKYRKRSNNQMSEYYRLFTNTEFQLLYPEFCKGFIMHDGKMYYAGEPPLPVNETFVGMMLDDATNDKGMLDGKKKLKIINTKR